MILNNPYKPHLVVIEDIQEESGGPRAVKTFKVSFIDENIKKNFKYKSGQSAMLSVFGKGECMICIASSPTKGGYLEFSVMRQGKVTSALHELNIGNVIGIRGPFGNHFPIEEWNGKNLIFIGGGIGQAPLRSAYLNILDNRKEYGSITIIYGARTSKDLSYKEETFELEKRDDINVYLCLDWKFGKGGMIDEEAEKGWYKISMKEPEKTEYPKGTTRFTGFVPQVVLATKPSPKNSIVITCGPPVMINLVIKNLKKLGFSDDQIYTTLEMRMKCGIGKCGRCNIGNIYVCKDGPVFSYAQLEKMSKEY
jgi:NAD(P)H-flavin reductase